MLEDELERVNNETLFRDYIGQAMWHIVTIQHLKTDEPNQMPQYVVLAHPEQMPKEEKLTADEIISRTLSKLG